MVGARWTAVALAVGLMGGCGGSDQPSPSSPTPGAGLTCIYMIDGVAHHPGQYAEWTFEFMVWAVRGARVDGLAGGMYSESVRQWLTVANGWAVGQQEAFPEGTQEVSFLVEGSGADLIVPGWDSVDAQQMQTYSRGLLGNGSVAGC